MKNEGILSVSENTHFKMEHDKSLPLEQVNSESVNNGVFMNQVKIILAGVVVKHRNCNTEQACKHTVYLIDLCV